MYDPETAGYLAKAAFFHAVGMGTVVGAGAGAVAGALNGDGKTSLVSRTLHGAAGGALAGAAAGALPHAWNKGHAAINYLRGAAAPAASALGHREKALVGGIGGVIGGIANTGGDNT